jgi:hypothetical protein
MSDEEAINEPINATRELIALIEAQGRDVLPVPKRENKEQTQSEM